MGSFPTAACLNNLKLTPKYSTSTQTQLESLKNNGINNLLNFINGAGFLPSTVVLNIFSFENGSKNVVEVL